MHLCVCVCVCVCACVGWGGWGVALHSTIYLKNNNKTITTVYLFQVMVLRFFKGLLHQISVCKLNTAKQEGIRRSVTKQTT